MHYLHNPQENLSSEVPDDIFYPEPFKLATSTSSVLVDSCLNPPLLKHDSNGISNVIMKDISRLF